MSLTLSQRMDRLRVRIAELAFWRERASTPIDGWQFDGTAIAVGERWPSRDGVLRFTARATVPAGWPLADTILKLDVGGESLLTLDYGGEEATFGLDPYHQEFPLRAGTFGIATESVPRLPFGEPVRDPHLTDARIVWIDRTVDEFTLLMRQILEASLTLGAHEVVPHLVSAAEKALYAIDWPSSTADYNARFAPEPGQQRIWQLPELKHAPAALSDDERYSVADAHQALVTELRRLKAIYPPQGKVAVTGHAHIDLAWLWPYAETRRKARRTFHTALELMDEFPSFIFNQSTAAYYAQIEEDDPALFERIVARVKSGEWETIGGMWVEPDTNMPTGESFVRQILYGQRYFEAKFGLRHTVCWLPDCFGFSPAMPQLLTQGGINSFFTIKVNWSETNRFPHDLFWWEGLDGSRVLAHTFDNPIQGYNGILRPDCVQPTWVNFRGKVLHDETLLAVGYGDGGGGVTPEMLRRQAQLADFPALPALRPARVDAFFEDLHATAKVKTLPTWVGEMYLELHRGTLTTQSDTKRGHRMAERSLITAETVSSLAMLLGAPRPASLETAWHHVLKNEFHDILPGSGIREIYDDAVSELNIAREAGLARQQEALAAIAARLPKGDAADALVVVNPDLGARPIRIEVDGVALAIDGSVPGLGIAVLDRTKLVAVPGLVAGTRHLENDFIRVEIGQDGSITRLVHKATGRDAIDGRANQLFAYPADKPRNWDAWDIEDDYTEKGIALDEVESIELIEAGPHRAAIRIVKRFRASTIVQTISLFANSARVDIRTDLDWHDRKVLLRALFPINVRAETATYECAFGVIRRPTHVNTSWDQAKFEVAGHRFVDLSEPGFGVALLNDGKYGHSARGNVLGLSLLRSPIYPDPLADEGKQSFTYSLYPHAGEWHQAGVREEAEDLNQPLLTVMGAGLATGAHALVETSGVGAALAVLKPAEDSDDLVLRVYEPAGARGAFTASFPGGWTLGETVSLMEEPVEATSAGLKPFEVKSWRVGRA